jgi:hypothetical protein
MRNTFFYLFATLFITAGLFNQWQQVECVYVDTLQDGKLGQDEFLFDPVKVKGAKAARQGCRPNTRCHGG